MILDDPFEYKKVKVAPPEKDRPPLAEIVEAHKEHTSGDNFNNERGSYKFPDVGPLGIVARGGKK